MRTLIRYSDGIFVEPYEVFGTEQTLIESFTSEEDLSKYSDEEIIEKIIKERPEHLKNATVIMGAHIPVFGLLDCINRCYGIKLGEATLVENEQWFPSHTETAIVYSKTGNFHRSNFADAYKVSLQEYKCLESFSNSTRRAVLPLATFIDIKIAGSLFDYLQFISSVRKQDNEFIKTIAHGMRIILWHLFQNVVGKWVQQKKDEKYD